MTPNEYVEKSQRSALDIESTAIAWTKRLCHETMDYKFKLLHGAIGICTESGELQDAIKKHLMYGKELDRENLHEELGDLMWYIAEVCTAMNFSLEDIMQANIAKLQKRYPEKFTEQDAIARKDKEDTSKIIQERVNKYFNASNS